ncbi:ABC transporter substrate-binding protein [Pseudomonas sp. NPDC089554]|uniref:ABC transporter substrate-binding protein n=1 Tax=Pseudomonas sp. NPDC089554 TaxID=3390653 RepID=UPI003D00C41B
MRKTLILTAGLMAAICANAQAQGTLNVAMNADIRSTQPGVNRDTNSDAVVLHLFEGLVAFREDATVGPLLAREVTTSEDGLTYTFRLRDGVTFHNGKPLTSKEVLWTWKRYLNPATQWRCTASFDGSGGAKVVDLQAPDEHTVVFTLDKPNALFLASMALPECGGSGIIHPDSVIGEQWVAPIGTGPFKLKEWKPGQYLDLDRFDAYTPRDEKDADGYTGNKSTTLDRVHLAIIPDPAAAKAALLSRNVDMLNDVSALEAKELETLQGVRVSASTTMSTSAVLFQTQDPLFADVRMRQALFHALDTSTLVTALTEGRSKPNPSMVALGSRYHTAAHAQGLAYSPEESRRLLKEAGYKGQPIQLITNKRYPNMFDIAVYVQAMAQQAGLNIQLQTMEWGTQLERYQSGNYQLMVTTYSERLDPALNYDAVTGDKAKEPRKVWGDAKARELIAEARREGDPAKRQALFDALHKDMLRDLPLIPLYNGNAITVTRDYVQGQRPWPVSKPRLWMISLDNQGKR